MPAAPPSPLCLGSLIIRVGNTGAVQYDAKWRIDGRQRMRRIGPAWLERDGDSWKPRRGRPKPGFFTEKTAIVRMAEIIAKDGAAHQQSKESEEKREEQGPTFRQVAHEWLEWVEDVKGARASTLRDYRSTLAEPGRAHKRGSNTCKGRAMAAFGDQPIAAITSLEVGGFLRSLDKSGISTRTIQ